MVNVTKENFIEVRTNGSAALTVSLFINLSTPPRFPQSTDAPFLSSIRKQTNDLLQHLPTAAFIAIDEEMTGITVPGTPRPAKEQPPSALYASTLKYVPERYSIIQLGVVLFHATSEPGEVHEWQARRYNFYVFPAQDGWSGETREVVLNPGAVAFLQQHNMSLDLWTQQGVTYQTNDKAYETVQAYVEKELIRERAAEDKERHAKLQDSTRRRVELRRSEDIDFHGTTYEHVAGNDFYKCHFPTWFLLH